MRCFAKFAIAGLLFALPVQSDAQDNIRLRAGLSTISGIVGLEVQNGSQAASLGWLPALGASEDFNETKPRLAIGARHFLSGPDVSGLFVGSVFTLNNSGYGFVGGDIIAFIQCYSRSCWLSKDIRREGGFNHLSWLRARFGGR
jgi:hypothetical protein